MEETKTITNEEVEAECIKRMRILDLDPRIIKDFKHGRIGTLEAPIGGYYWLDDETKGDIADWENQTGCTVYTVIRTYTTLGVMDSYMYVSKEDADLWERNKDDLKQGFVCTYTRNNDYPHMSDLGYIEFSKIGGGLVRTV